jgi:maltose alpha-D-glucosyltransferase/alpha-amylase
MLRQARLQAALISGRGVQWRHPYGEPQPRQAVRRASVWLLDYGGSVIPRPGRSVIATWADPELWHALRRVGIDLLHTGPVNRGGGIRGRQYTPSLDGWFDPIALEVDPQFGTEEDFRRLVRVAAEHDGLIAGDLVPLHTGTGADFRLALMAYRDYLCMYTMVEVRKEDWPLLPAVDGPSAAGPPVAR